MPSRNGDIRKTARWQRLARKVRARRPLTCQRCNQPIDPSLRHPHTRSFTLGHIIKVEDRPDLAFDPTNVGPEHRGCNIAAENQARPTRLRTNPSRRW